MSEPMTAEDDAAFRAATDGMDGQPAPERDSGDPHAHRRLDLAHLIALADTQIQYRCQGFLADGFLTVLAGRGGEGKSLTAMALAGGVLTGTTVAGIDCTSGRVAIFDAENGPRLIGQRLKLSGTPHTGLTVSAGDPAHRGHEASRGSLQNLFAAAAANQTEPNRTTILERVPDAWSLTVSYDPAYTPDVTAYTNAVTAAVPWGLALTIESSSLPMFEDASASKTFESVGSAVTFESANLSDVT